MTKAAYVVLGITMEGRKDILSVWIGEHETSKFWLNVLNDLKSRGVKDMVLNQLQIMFADWQGT